MSNLNEEKSLLVAQKDLGTVRSLTHRGRRVQYRLPKEIESKVTLRFKGHGSTANGETGDLLLHVQVDRGRDWEAVLWLSQREAQAGAQKHLRHRRQLVGVAVPPSSVEGQLVRV